VVGRRTSGGCFQRATNLSQSRYDPGMDIEKKKELWNRLENESERAYRAFESYRNLPSSERVLIGAYRQHVGNRHAAKPSDTWGSTTCRTTRSASEPLTKRTATTGTTGLLGGKAATQADCVTINTPVVHQPTRTTASGGDGTETKIGDFAGVFEHQRTVAVSFLRIDAEEVGGSNPLSPTALRLRRLSSNYLVSFLP
jgi:hypothetical protein